MPMTHAQHATGYTDYTLRTPLRAEAYEPGGTADPSRRGRAGCLHSSPPRPPGLPGWQLSSQPRPGRAAQADDDECPLPIPCNALHCFKGSDMIPSGPKGLCQ